jgi:hypothetical protein
LVLGILLVRSLLAAAAVYPTSPAAIGFSAKDYSGRPVGLVTVWTGGSRLRVEGFGRVVLFDGRAWLGEAPDDDSAGLAAFIAPVGRRGVQRDDYAGRPLLIVDYPAGRRQARIDYRYDEAGILAANLVFSDGTGYQFRRVSLGAHPVNPADFELPRKVEAAPAGAAAAPEGSPDYPAVTRLLAMEIPDKEQADFEKQGGIGRYRPVTRR